MKYVSQDDLEIEWIWNSRDGVTPFAIKNRTGTGLLQHDDWHLDRCLPNYRPHPGERVFVSITLERALQKATNQADLAWESEEYNSIREMAGTKENLAIMLMEKYQIGVTPDLVFAKDVYEFSNSH